MKQMFGVLDFETTGLDYTKEQVIEIGAIKFDFEREYGTFHTVVALDDGRHMSDFIQNLTRLTPEAVSYGPPAFRALSNLYAFFYDSKNVYKKMSIVAQHAPFDLAYFSEVYTVESFYCTRSMAKILFPDESASLKNIYKMLFGKEVPGHHSALYDARATQEVFGALANIIVGRGMDLTSFENVLVRDDRPINYMPKDAVIINVNEIPQFVAVCIDTRIKNQASKGGNQNV